GRRRGEKRGRSVALWRQTPTHQGMGARYGTARSDQGIERRHLSGAGPAGWLGTDAGRRKEAWLRQHGDWRRGRSLLAGWPLAISAVEQTEFLSRLVKGS